MDAEEGTAPALPPTEYRRMLSWQLSQVSREPVRKSRKTQKESERRRERQIPDLTASVTGSRNGAGSSEGDEEEEEDEEYAYLVINSEGEEECYYSAPESPLDSDEEGEREGEGEGEGEVCLPPQERKRGGRSKKVKKKIRNVVRLAEIEFFAPLCDLVEGALEVEVVGGATSSHVDVPSLAELCVRSIQSEKLDSDHDTHLPFLIHALIGAHRVHRSLASLQVGWVERLLAAWEDLSQHWNTVCQDAELPLAYSPRQPWNIQTEAESPNPFQGLHLPLPFPATSTVIEFGENSLSVHFRSDIACLLLFANYLYPGRGLSGVYSGSKLGGSGRGSRSRAGVGGSLGLCGGGGSLSGGPPDKQELSPSQRASIARVNHFLSSRYKRLCEDHREFLKVWPGYVLWARGQVELALSAFTATLDSLQYGIDKALTLNEMGRMMLMFGDRYSAALFFTKSREIEVSPIQKVYEPDRDMGQPHLYALQAAVWDCGLLGAGVAKQAAQAWSQFLRASHSLPPAMWYLHLAAVESRMMVHAGTSVGSQPGSPLSDSVSSVRGWLCELLELVVTLTGTHSVLYYHHSLLLAMSGRSEEARNTFLRFYDMFALLRERRSEEGFPGDPFSLVTNHRLLNPWLPLCNMLHDQGLTSVPILRVRWRTRLLHPMYPYIHTECVNYLADHCSSDINLRLSDSGYVQLTAHSWTPTQESVCFSPSLNHYLTGPVADMRQSRIVPDELAVPWPMRLVEWEGGDGGGHGVVVVELVMAGGVDSEMKCSQCYHTNHSAILRWQRGSQHAKLDLRLAIRRELKKAILLAIEKRKLEGKEKILTAMMERSFIVTANRLESLQDVPSKHTKSTYKIYTRVKKKVGKKEKMVYECNHFPQRVRSSLVDEFNLELTEYVVFGEATLAMVFSLRPFIDISVPYHGHTLALINCTSQESFLRPRIYCTTDFNDGFYNVQPSNKDAALYPSRHLPHVRYMIVSRNESDQHSLLVLDQNGDLVSEHPYSKGIITFSVGERIFHWSNHIVMPVNSYSLQMRDCVHSVQYPDIELQDVVPVPGCMLVHSRLGLSLLNPGSLELLVLEYKCKKPDAEERDALAERLCQIPVERATFSVLSVFNVEGCSERCTSVHSSGCENNERMKEEGREKTKGEAKEKGEEREEGGEREEEDGEEEEGDSQREERKRELGGKDFGSCCVALTLNSRLLVFHIPHKTGTALVLMDVVLPGKVTEFYNMDSFGYMVSVSQFPDRFREELYWLSPSGQLRGMLPCLGGGRHSFLSATIPPSTPSTSREEEEEEGWKQCVFFNDGQGAVCCVPLGVD